MLLALAAFLACDTGSSDPAATEDPCPEISLEQLPGDYLKWAGGAADHTRRIRIFREGEGWKAWFVGGGFTKVTLGGVERPDDVRFTEALAPSQQALFDKGDTSKVRLYFQPHKKTCSLRVIEAKVKLMEGKEKEFQQGAGYQTYVPLPDQYVFTFQPAGEPLFLGKAAKDARAAAAQLSRYGVPDPGHPLGEAIPVGLWTDVAADGPADCKYIMDLSFDDRPVEGKQGIVVDEVEGDQRHWYAEWYAPYSGNHMFEMYRYRSCGAERELIAVAGIEAILD